MRNTVSILLNSMENTIFSEGVIATHVYSHINYNDIIACSGIYSSMFTRTDHSFIYQLNLVKYLNR